MNVEPRTWDQVRELVVQMRDAQGPLIAKMREVLSHYNGEWVIPMPELDSEPILPNLTPALVADAVDFLSTRAASTTPRTSCPALDPTKDRGVRSREYASIRSKAIAATYEQSKWKLGRRKFYRHLTAYATGAIMVEPYYPDYGSNAGYPCLQVRDPLNTYAEPQAAVDLRRPNYVAFTTERSGAYLRKMFPMMCEHNGGPITDSDQNKMWTMVEWIDEQQRMYGLLGPTTTYGSHIAPTYQDYGMGSAQAPSMQIGPAFPNRLGRVTGVVPANVSLNQMASRIGAMLGNVELQAKLMALNITAIERSIFPDTFAICTPMGQPAIVGGVWEDGRTQKINLLKDVTQVGNLRSQPDPMVMTAISQLERNFSKSNGLVPQAGGETYGALRTGRGIDALASIALDPTIQEMHEISEIWMAEINTDIFDIYKEYWPNRQYSMYSTWPGDLGLVEFTPSTHFESTQNTVSYVIAGADITQTVQILGSSLGTGAISLRTFRDLHPWVADAEAEGRIVDDEQFEDAAKQAVLQQLMSGQMPLATVALINGYRNDGKDIFEAIDMANKEAQRLQATQAPPPQPGQVAAPEAMPGLAAGPAALQQPAPEQQQIQPFGEVDNMRQLMSQMGAQAGV